MAYRIVIEPSKRGWRALRQRRVLRLFWTTVEDSGVYMDLSKLTAVIGAKWQQLRHEKLGHRISRQQRREAARRIARSMT
jgi:hypothetical protein